MAKQRMINTRFWSDTYISELDPIEKLLFIYFLTNQYTNLSWIYELSLKHIALDTWIDKQEMLPKIIKRFSDTWKIYYIDWWIYIKNFQKYQNSENPKIKKWIDREISDVPSYILEKIKDIDTLSIPYPYPITLNLTKLNLTKPNVNELEIDSDKKLDFESENNNQSHKQKNLNICFEEFRNLYNKKISKPKTETKRNNLTNKEREAIMEAVPKYLSTIKDKQFQKHPLTYLNQRSREDEIYISWPNYQDINEFHRAMAQDKQIDIKQRFDKKFWDNRKKEYTKTKSERKKTDLYLSM